MYVLIGSTRGQKNQTLAVFLHDLNIDVPCNSLIADFCKLAFSEVFTYSHCTFFFNVSVARA